MLQLCTPSQFISRRLVRRLPRLPPPPMTQSPFAIQALVYLTPPPAALLPDNGAFGPAPSPVPGSWAFRCPHCGSPEPAARQRKISTAGWVVFAVLLVFCFPLCFLGLLITEESLQCGMCGTQLG